MFDESDLAEFAELVEMASQEFQREDGVVPKTSFKAAMEEKPAEIGSVFGNSYAENYSISGRTAMLYLTPDVQLTANDIILASRTNQRWQVHHVTDAAFPVTVMRFALLSIAPM